MIKPTNRNSSLPEKAEAAFEQAARKVVERARQTGTPIVVWEVDRVIEILPEQAMEWKLRSKNEVTEEDNHE